MRIPLTLVLGCLVLEPALAAPANPSTPTVAADLTRRWPASWIAAAGAPANEFGVYLFRRTFELAGPPARFVVHVSADSRYRLFVNGRSVCYGPQRSDAWMWRYETVDLAPWLQAGTNVIAAQVWSYGELTPYATLSERTGFLLQGETAAERIIDTGAAWKALHDPAYQPLPAPNLNTYIVVGPGFRLDGARHPWAWETAAFDDKGWASARVISRAAAHGWGSDIDHPLAPRNLPLMEETPVRFAAVRRSDGVEIGAGFPAAATPLRVAANTRARLLLDQGVETNAFPELVVSGGAGGRIRLSYAEALVDAAGRKGNRNEVDGRTLAGLADEFLPDGSNHRRFSGPNFRTYRYVQVDIETAHQPLVIEDLAGQFTGYPFVSRATFTSDDPSLQRVWEVGWRTARLCALETYVDCPYYEQLQYVGDTRIQALISLYVTGDDRLMRNAIELYDRSRLAGGLTQSRYPSVVPQVINTFSLFWIEMVRDYWMLRPDEAFVRAQLPGVEAVLDWFERRIDSQTGLLGPLPYWTFVDWTDQWEWNEQEGIGGEPDGARAGGSSIVSLQLAGTLRHAAELARAFGRGASADRYDRLATQLCDAARRTCWDAERRLFADTPAKRSFSQHANTMAVLAGATAGTEARDLMQRVRGDRSLIQGSTYFRFYLLRALKQAGMGDDYLGELAPWRTMLDLGLTTFAEKPEPTRSDCHAWSASPVYELLATVAGIEPASPGFATVRIEPHLGQLKHAQAVMPHPAGEIRASYERMGDRLKATLVLPAGVSGDFHWRGHTVPLHAGEQKLEL